jgi:ABC-type cobalamin/Fe3+-siderophores transport system ATPase subunit
VVLLEKGRVVADGRKEELLTGERLGALFGVSVKLFHEDGYFYLHA